MTWQFTAPGSDNDVRAAAAQLDDDPALRARRLPRLRLRRRGPRVRRRVDGPRGPGLELLQQLRRGHGPSSWSATSTTTSATRSSSSGTEISSRSAARCGSRSTTTPSRGSRSSTRSSSSAMAASGALTGATDHRRATLGDLDQDGRDELYWLHVDTGVDGPFPIEFVWWLTLHRWTPEGHSSYLVAEEDVSDALIEGYDLVTVDDNADGIETLVVTHARAGLAEVPHHDPRDQPLRPFVPQVPQGEHPRRRRVGCEDAPRARRRRLRRRRHDPALDRQEGALPPRPDARLRARRAADGRRHQPELRPRTEVSYGLSTTTTESFTVSTGTSYSTWAGFEVEDIFGNGASAKTTISTEMETSLGESTSFTKMLSFQGSYDPRLRRLPGHALPVLHVRDRRRAGPAVHRHRARDQRPGRRAQPSSGRSTSTTRPSPTSRRSTPPRSSVTRSAT